MCWNTILNLREGGLSTSESERILSGTRETVSTLKQAFQMQFEKLMQDELMDMEADLKLLKQTLRSEGYREQKKRKVLNRNEKENRRTHTPGYHNGGNRRHLSVHREQKRGRHPRTYFRQRIYRRCEKTELLEDEEVQDILQNRYHLKTDYSKAGSLDMMTADLNGKNYLFPSSSIAEEYYTDLYGDPVQSEIILNTPIVLYTHRSVP